MKITTLSAPFFEQKELRDLNTLVQRFAHVVNREGGGSGGDQGFHLDAGLGGGGHLSANLHAIFAHAGVHINVSEQERMTKRYPLGGALGSQDAGDAGDFKRIALGIFEFADPGQDARRHFDEGVGDCGAMGVGLGGDLHHTGFAASVVLREFGHWLSGMRQQSPRRRTWTRSPASMFSRSGGTTKRQFARDIATTSPEPCQGMGETRGGLCVNETLGVREPGSRCRDSGVVSAAEAVAALP